MRHASFFHSRVPRPLYFVVFTNDCSHTALEADFASGALHPGDLKAALTTYINA